MYKVNDFKLEKGSAFPDYEDNLFYVMRDYHDFPNTILQRVNKLLNHSVEDYEQKHKQHIILSDCELSVWLDINRNTKVMCLNLLIIDDKREVEVDEKELIKPEDNLYSECKRIFMHRLEEFLFTN